MSSIAALTAYDGAASPVAHVFAPISVTRKGDVVEAYWRETGLAVPLIAQPTLFMRSQRLKSGVWRTERKVVVPVMEAILNQNAAGYTAMPKVAHELTDIRVVYSHERADTAMRRLIRQLGINIDGNVSTSVAAVASGHYPELHDLLVNPT